MTSSFRLKPMLLAVLILAGIWQVSLTNSPFSNNVALADEPAATTAAVVPAAVTPVAKPDDWWQSRHKVMNTRAELDAYDVLFIGDSITHGWEGAGQNV